MAGLILLAVLVAFIALLIWLSGLVTWRLRPSRWKTLLRTVIVIAVFPLMMIDEIIGKYQFEALCRANGIESADVSKARGKYVRFEIGKPSLLKGTIIPGDVRDWFYKDADNGEVLINYKEYFTHGGWLMRYTPLSMGSPRPMLFPASCGSSYSVRNIIFPKNNISLIN